MARRAAVFLLLLGLACAAAALRNAPGLGDEAVDKRRRGPWFCHGRDCPHFKTVREEADYSLRCYERTTWAISCAYDAYLPDGVLRATANVLNYVEEHDLWGATPLAHVVHLSLDNQRAWQDWNASAADAQAELPQGSPNWAHKLVCAAYYLPDKYQAAVPPARAELDRRPPRPGRRSHVRILRARRLHAFVSGFHGFPTPPRFIWQTMQLVHQLKWQREEFDWTTAVGFVYDPPTAVEGRWNEVLIPARRFHDVLLEGEELYGGEEAE